MLSARFPERFCLTWWQTAAEWLQQSELHVSRRTSKVDLRRESGLVMNREIPNRSSDQCSELVTETASLPPLRDLLQRSLGPLRGLWNKLHYLTADRDGKGAYAHWGFMRAHGEKAGQKAFAAAHSELFAKALTTPLAELYEDARLSAAAQECATPEFLGRLQAMGQALIPKEKRGCLPEHFSSILEVLCLLEADRERSTRPAA
jgi:hypothetical protein